MCVEIKCRRKEQLLDRMMSSVLNVAVCLCDTIPVYSNVIILGRILHCRSTSKVLNFANLYIFVLNFVYVPVS